MDLKATLAPISKAVAGALASGVLALLARYGFDADTDVKNALELVFTFLLVSALTFVSVYFAPKNKVVK